MVTIEISITAVAIVESIIPKEVAVYITARVVVSWVVEIEPKIEDSFEENPTIFPAKKPLTNLEAIRLTIKTGIIKLLKLISERSVRSIFIPTIKKKTGIKRP